jgi:hypothetical protein
MEAFAKGCLGLYHPKSWHKYRVVTFFVPSAIAPDIALPPHPCGRRVTYASTATPDRNMFKFNDISVSEVGRRLERNAWAQKDVTTLS